LTGAERAMERFFDDFCGTPWHRPFSPRPSYLGWALAVELVRAANAGSGSFREGMLRAAGQLADKAFAVANQYAAAFGR